LRIDDIQSGLTFYGNILPNSQKEHLGIVLMHTETDVQYCYCTSQDKIKNIYKNYYTIRKEIMEKYFPNNAKESYIVLSQNFILNMLCITLVSNTNMGEFECLGILDKVVFNDLLQKILEADTISAEFKAVMQDYFEMK
jgi:hypothetical protein